MLKNMDKTDSKPKTRGNLKGKKSAKKFKQLAAKPKGPKPEQHTGDPGESKDQNGAAKIERNKQMMQKKKKKLEQGAKGELQQDGAKGKKTLVAGEKGDRKAVWKKGKQPGKKLPKGEGADGKDERPKLVEMSKKDRKVERKKVKTNYELSQRSKQIWEKVRDRHCTKDTRTKLLDELYGLIKGKAKELVMAHDTVRVIQCCVKYGTDEQRQLIFDEVKDEMLNLCKSKYGKFYVLKVLRCGTRKQRDFIIQSFYGNVCKLVQHSTAAEVVEMAYNNWANAQHRSALLEEFYGAKYAVFKTAGIHTLSDILAAHPENTQSIMEHMLKVLTPLIEKSVIKHTIVHKAILDFLTHAPINMKTELIQLMREVVVQILHTQDGAKAAMHCVWFGTTKDRKLIIKSFKTFVERICQEEFGHRVLLALFDVVDDTKLVSKVIIEEMMKSLSTIGKDQYGRKVIFYLLTPRDPNHFHPDVVKLLEGGDNNPNSKKDKPARRKELLEAASTPLLQLVTMDTKEKITDKSYSQVVKGILEHSVDVDGKSKRAAYQAIADLAAEDFTPASPLDKPEQMHIAEHPAAHFLLRCLLKWENATLEKQTVVDYPSVLFSDILLNTVSVDNLKSWLGCNRSAFILVSLAESPRETVKEKMRSVLTPLKKTMKDSTIKGVVALYKVLFDN